MKIISLCTNLILALLITSCAIHEKHSGYFIQVYKESGFGEIPPNYLILKIMERSYELYSPAAQLNILGSIQINNDTIHLIPKFEYNGRQLKAVDTIEISTLTIPVCLIKCKRELLDITDLKKYPELTPYIFRNKLFNNFKLITN